MTSDEEILRMALEQINLYGYVDGRMLRQRVYEASGYQERTRVPPQRAFTDALRRWEKRGELRGVVLAGPRGGNAGVGYVLPERQPRLRLVE